jgi:DNA polymerase V
MMVALVDCNNFYASVEKMFDPSLKNKPVVVLSNNDGCAIARSEEAKALGVEMGTPAFMIADLLKNKDVSVFSSNYTLYGSMSERVAKILKSFVARVEIYSIDEAFLDLSDLSKTDFASLARQLRKTILAHTGLPVTVGIAPTKTLAKMANRFAKKFKKEEGVHVAISQECINEMLEKTETGDIWGIGPQYRKLLLQHHFKTGADLLNAPEDWIRKELSVVGQRLLYELKGIPAIEWEDKPPAKKNICTARSFGRLLTDIKDISQAVASHAASCARKLRRDHTCAKNVNVFLQTNPYRSEDQQYLADITIALPVATNNTTEIIKYAVRALHMIYRKGFNYLKAGVMVIDLVPQQQVQLGLFDKRDREKDKKLMMAIDQSNTFFGKDMIRYGTHGYGNEWKLRAEKLSARYTTRLEEIMQVKAY